MENTSIPGVKEVATPRRPEPQGVVVGGPTAAKDKGRGQAWGRQAVDGGGPALGATPGVALVGDGTPVDPAVGQHEP